MFQVNICRFIHFVLVSSLFPLSFHFFISVYSKTFQINRGYPIEKLIFGHPDEFIRPDMYIRPCVHEHTDIFSKGAYAKPKILKILNF